MIEDNEESKESWGFLFSDPCDYNMSPLGALKTPENNGSLPSGSLLSRLARAEKSLCVDAV